MFSKFEIQYLYSCSQKKVLDLVVETETGVNLHFFISWLKTCWLKHFEMIDFLSLISLKRIFVLQFSAWIIIAISEINFQISILCGWPF